MNDVITLRRERGRCGDLIVAHRRHENADDVLTIAVHERRDGSTIEVIQPPADEREAVRGLFGG